MTRPKTIKVLDGFAKTSDADVVLRGTAVGSKLPGNPYFPIPPVDLEALKAAIDRLQALMAEALDGSKKVEQRKIRGLPGR